MKPTHLQPKHQNRYEAYSQLRNQLKAAVEDYALMVTLAPTTPVLRQRLACVRRIRKIGAKLQAVK